MNLLNIISFACLCVPTAWELFDDKSGDKNKSADVIYRLVLMAGAATAAHYISGENWLTAFNLSLAIHFLIFDYAIAAILIKNGTIESPLYVGLSLVYLYS